MRSSMAVSLHQRTLSFSFAMLTEFSVPPTGGWGIGIDRLAMVRMTRPQEVLVPD